MPNYDAVLMLRFPLYESGLSRKYLIHGGVIHIVYHFKEKYIADWDINVTKSKNAAEMRENVLKQYPG